MLQSANDNKKNLYRRSFPICPKCSQTCSKEANESFVRAFNQVYHYHCFICEDCGIPVANKFFTVEDKQQRQKRNKKLILCEKHYLTRTRLTCLKCNKPITAISSSSNNNNNTQYHSQCIQCPSCTTTSTTTTTTATNSTNQYEFKGTNYCRLHYSQIPQTHCSGCDQAILKNYVEHQDFPNQIWHPECYMIYKFWSIKLKPTTTITVPLENEQDLIQFQNNLHQKVTRVWTDLSSFEESSANCISDMLLHVASGAYIEGIRMANQFVMHLHVLFSALSNLNQQLKHQDLQQCSDQANLICKDMIRFFDLLTASKSSAQLTQQLLSLVTSLAKNLKYLIRIALASSLVLEQEYGIENAIPDFLNQLSELDKKRVWIAGRYWFKDTPTTTTITDMGKPELIDDACFACHEAIRNSDCYQSPPYQWHTTCFQCTTCSAQLSSSDAVFTPPSLYCTTCHPNETNPRSLTFSYSYEQSLSHLTHYLGKIASHLNEQQKKKSPPDPIKLPDSKRQRSLLLKLVNRQPPKDLTIQTSAFMTQEDVVVVESPSTIISPINKLSQNVKRTFSARRKSSSSTFRNFLKPRRASILTMDEYGQTTHKYAQMTAFTASQNFILRHAAVIALHPLISSSNFTMDQLVSLVETHHHHHPSALWTKLLHHVRSNNNNNRTFGVSLATVAQRDHDFYLVQQKSNGVTLRDDTPTLAACFSENACIPIFIKSIISVILKSDMSVEGVFRKNGNIRNLKTCADTIDRTSNLDTIESLLIGQPGVQLAALLKRYLRELPEPLFPFAFHRLFVECSRDENAEKRRQVLHLACCLLPKPNRDTMCMIFCCLKWVASFSETNKMDVHNLARVVAPSVLFEKAEPIHRQAQEEIRVVETLIQNIEEISTVPANLMLLTLHDVNHDLTDLSSKYFINEYQKLLNKM